MQSGDCEMMNRGKVIGVVDRNVKLRRSKFEWSLNTDQSTGQEFCYLNEQFIGGIYLSNGKWTGYSCYALDKHFDTPIQAKRFCEDSLIKWINGIKYKRPNR